jgi:aminotransferase
MKNVSLIAQEVTGSPIRKMFNIAGRMKDVISFTVGEPDFVTPRNIMDAAVRSLERGETHYTPNAGLLPVREAIATRMNEELSVSPDPETEIIVTAGGMEALMLGMMVLIDPGDEVIISDPHWSNYPRQVQMCGGVPRFVPVREEEGFVLDPEEVRKAITEKTKIIVLNSPSNPTGAVMDRERTREIARLAVQHDLFVISDEVYHHFLYDGAVFTSISTLEGMRERTLAVDSLSKTYAMTGWRVGYAVGPELIVKNMVKYQENLIGCVNSQAQYAAIEALEGPQDALRRMLRTYTDRRKAIVEGINGIANLSCVPPKGAFYCFVNIRKARMSSEEFAMELLKETGVVTVPGSGFGRAGEGYMRLSYATSEENIARGLERIRRFMESRRS